MLRFKSCQARVLDYERKFQEAAQRYFELSQTNLDPALNITESDTTKSLELAVS